jgi:hypothetical protein
MEDPKKEPIAISRNQDSKLCLNCGFPNRNTDSKCMYCRTSLTEDAGLINWLRQTYYVLRWRWQLKQKREGIEKPIFKTPFYRKAGYLFLGLVLSGSGIFVFTSAVGQNSFTSGLIALLLMGYGVFTLKNLLIKQE